MFYFFSNLLVPLKKYCFTTVIHFQKKEIFEFKNIVMIKTLQDIGFTLFIKH